MPNRRGVGIVGGVGKIPQNLISRGVGINGGGGGWKIALNLIDRRVLKKLLSIATFSETNNSK